MYNYSLVVPLFNSQQHLFEFLKKLDIFVAKNEKLKNKTELILVVDGGKTDYRKEFDYIKCKVFYIKTKVYCSVENFGQLNATTFGILAADGKRVITLDIDHYLINNLFETIFKEEEEELLLFEIKEKNKPFYRKIGAALNHYIFKGFVNLEITKGSSLRSIKKSYLDKIQKKLKKNCNLLDYILISNTNQIKFKQFDSIYSKSSYSTMRLIKLFLSNLKVMIIKEDRILKSYEKVYI